MDRALRARLQQTLYYDKDIAPVRRYPEKLHHDVPHWVEPGALFHIRIAQDRSQPQTQLTDPKLARRLLDSARFYEDRQRWFPLIFLLMPDHIHALLAFPLGESMSSVIGDWKRFHARQNGIVWQEGYFDHRLRDDERREQLESKVTYIRRNPVAAGLCERVEDWPWVCLDGLG